MVKPIYIIATAGILTGLVMFMGNKVNVKGKRVAVIGDSHSALYREGWQDVLSWKHGFELNNLAVGGKSTPWMLETLKKFYSDGNKADVVFIYGGANDSFGNAKLENIVKNIQAMVDLVRSHSGVPIVISGFNYEKAVKPKVSSKYDDGIERYRQLQKLIEKEIKNADVVPVWEDVDANSTAGDGFHLPASKQKLFADYVNKKVLKA
jgi:lysophospholipase L1-like esterase